MDETPTEIPQAPQENLSPEPEHVDEHHDLKIGKKSIFFLLAIVAILIGANIFVFKFAGQIRHKFAAFPTAFPSPTTQAQPGGTISWNPNIEEIPETPTLALVKSLAATSRGIEGDTITGVKYYDVGTWQTGQYKNEHIIDAVLTMSFTAGISGLPSTIDDIVRETAEGKNLVVYAKSSSPDVVSFHDDATHQLPSGILLNNNSLPDLLSSANLYVQGPGGSDAGPIPFPAMSHGQTINFTFEPALIQGDFIPQIKTGYKLFSTFLNGQQVYGKDQGQTIQWSDLQGDPYYIQDVDHTEDGQTSDDTFPAYGNNAGITWSKSPDLLNDVQNYHNQYDTKLTSPSQISYYANFGTGCTNIPISDLAGNLTLSTNDLELVGTMSGYQIYAPTNASAIIQNMYNDITKNQSLDLSVDRYSQSFPIVVLKDNFGDYQAVFRSDYPGHAQGCGKPVIYLYPTQKTNVHVSFGENMKLSKTEPSYENGWDVTAYPDGHLVNNTDGKTYPYLYWEGFTPNQFPDLNYGSVVQKDNIKGFLAKSLSDYGLNQKESKDFMDYWVPYLSSKPYYLISFYTTQDLDQAIPENISPKPDSVLRLLMQYKGLDKPIQVSPPPTPVKFDRTGFSVVEWGGIYGN